MSKTENNKSAESGQRKAYQSPRLEKYGTVRALTNSVGMTTNLDGMATGNTKTA